jgi:hypothetical protein
MTAFKLAITAIQSLAQLQDLGECGEKDHTVLTAQYAVQQWQCLDLTRSAVIKRLDGRY